MAELNIHFEVSLSRETLDVLRQFAPDMPAEICDPAAHPFFKTAVENAVIDFLDRAWKRTQEKPVDEPKPETAPEPVPEEKPAPAPQQDPAPAPEKEITDADLRQAVKAAKDKVGTPVVKALFAEFEIPNSSACPQERRGELMDRLEKLAA
jgi:outer membrane biosynthesis protein TonB